MNQAQKVQETKTVLTWKSNKYFPGSNQNIHQTRTLNIKMSSTMNEFPLSWVPVLPRDPESSKTRAIDIVFTNESVQSINKYYNNVCFY